MSSKTARPRDEATHLSAGHLSQNASDESKKELDDELAREDENTTATDTESSGNSLAILQQLENIQQNLPQLIKGLEDELEGVNKERQALDTKEKDIRNRIRLIRVLNGEKVEEEQQPRRRRGRRRRNVVGDGSTTTVEGGSEETPRRGGQGKRFKNDYTLKEVIAMALLDLKHPQTGVDYTSFVDEITNKVILSTDKGGLGYRSTSAKPTNTVRIQMYRLEEEKKVVVNNDGSYTLLPSGIEAAKKQLEEAKNAPAQSE